MILLKQIGRFCRIESEIREKLNNYLYRTLSYTKPSARFMSNPMFGIVRLYNRDKKIFPIGLLDKVKIILEEWRKQTGEDYEIELSEKLEQHPVQLSNLRNYQIDAFNAVWKANGGTLVAPTGSGKTVIAERIIAASGINCKKLILVPSKDLKAQWEKELDHMINSIPDIIRIATYQKIIREIQTKEGREELNTYDLIIADETHMVAAKTFYKVLMSCSKAKMVLGLTATAVGRSDGEDMKIKAAVGDIIYSIPIQELTKQGYLVPARVKVIDVEKYIPSFEDEYRDIYKNAIVLNKERNQKAVDIALRECKNGIVFIYIDIIEHGELILKMLKDKGHKNVMFVHGETPDRKKVLEDVVAGKYDIVIGSKVYGTGVNVKKFKTMVLLGAGKGQIKIIQLVGRMLRLNEGKESVDIYDFADNCKNLKGHYGQRIKIYKSLGFEVLNE